MEKLECELHYFGFSVEQMKLERRHFIWKKMFGVIKKIVETITDDPDVSKEVKDKLRTIQKLVAEKMFIAMETTIQEMEKLDDQNFTIPKKVLQNNKKVSKDDEANLKADIESLTKQLLQNKAMILAFENENAKYDKLKDYIAEEQTAVQTVLGTFNTIIPGNTLEQAQNILSFLNKNNYDIEPV